MATIQYTKYSFNSLSLIHEKRQSVVKHKIQSDPSFNPFKEEAFNEKYKILILLYVTGVTVALLLATREVDSLKVIGGIYSVLTIFGFFSLVPEWMSYFSYLISKNLHFLKTLKRPQTIITLNL